jgi:hypothetical protein
MVAHAYCPMKIGVVMVDVVRAMAMINYPILIYCAADDRYNLTFLEAPDAECAKRN